jgi:uncharacterized membrane protein YeiH
MFFLIDYFHKVHADPYAPKLELGSENCSSGPYVSLAAYIIRRRVLSKMLLQSIELMAVVTAGLYGVLLARRAGMDFVGVFTIAFFTAFGGGTLRDLFLDRNPLFWIANGHYPIIVFVLAIIFSVAPRFPRRIERLLPIPDALGLALFSIIGAAYAMENETPLFVASMMGVITGTFGGVIGDVLRNETPSLFKPSTPLYATCAFAGAWAYILLHGWGVAEEISLTSGFLIITVMRFAAIKWDIRLPDLSEQSEDE